MIVITRDDCTSNHYRLCREFPYLFHAFFQTSHSYESKIFLMPPWLWILLHVYAKYMKKCLKSLFCVNQNFSETVYSVFSRNSFSFTHVIQKLVTYAFVSACPWFWVRSPPSINSWHVLTTTPPLTFMPRCSPVISLVSLLLSSATGPLGLQ